jgi:serine protease Do
VEIPKFFSKKKSYLSKLSLDVEEVVKIAKDAVLVVNIERNINQKNFNFGPESEIPFDLFKFFGPSDNDAKKRKAIGQGSGFIIHPSGLAITNHHVVEGAEKIKVKVGNSVKIYTAEIIGSDELTDVALIQISSNRNNWPIIPLGNSSTAHVGSFALAIGNPFGLELSASFGIISAKGRRDLAPSGRRGLYNFMQIDVGINPGNSGGPLLNLNGDAIGINTAISANGQNIGFAIPIDQVKSTIMQIKKYGHIDRSWLGLQISDVDTILANAIGLKSVYGAVIIEVAFGSPAYKGGLMPGDVITSINERIIKNASGLSVMTGLAGVGKKIKLRIYRNQKWYDRIFKLEKKPEKKIEKDSKLEVSIIKINGLGISISNLNNYYINKLKLKNIKFGVLITNIVEGSVGSIRFGLKKNDIILKVNNKKIKTTKDVLSAMKRVKENEALMLLFRRGESTRFISAAMPKIFKNIEE